MTQVFTKEKVCARRIVSFRLRSTKSNEEDDDEDSDMARNKRLMYSREQ